MINSRSTPAKATRRYRARIKGRPSGHALVKLLRDSPLHDLEFERTSVRSRIRPVKL
ncbi:MAG: hypothetical protein M3P06_21970 [Acidobacteriota bacterium]|nr:hypothetical protein [Acidobacteriota bacterium]